MIAVNTHMKYMPDNCCNCVYYVSKISSVYGCPTCSAVGWRYFGTGRTILECDTSSERPEWCPLVKV